MSLRPIIAASMMCLVVVLVFACAGVPARAQANRATVSTPGPQGTETKRNDRPPETNSTPQRREENKKPQFIVRRILIEHDAMGRGKIIFERQNEETPIVEPIELSTAALGRILGFWGELHFLDSTENYQSAKQFPHLGTMWIKMENGERKRTAEFNWSNNRNAWNLVTEYRRVADQAILIFNMNVAREIQPLNAPQLMDELELLYTRNGLSDPQQLVPLLKDLRTDEHIPLIARNHADRLLKKIEK